MTNRERILSVISERQEITVPELQMLLSLSYKEVRKELDALVVRGLLTFEGGMTFRAKRRPSGKQQKGEECHEAEETAPIQLDSRLRRIADEVRDDPRLAKTVEYYGRHVEERFGISRLQVLLLIGYGQAELLRQKCLDLGLCTAEGRYLLTARESLAVLGKGEPVSAERKEQPNVFLFARPSHADTSSRDNIVAEMLRSVNLGNGEKVHLKGPKEDPDDDDFPFEFDEDVDLDEEEGISLDEVMAGRVDDDASEESDDEPDEVDAYVTYFGRKYSEIYDDDFDVDLDDDFSAIAEESALVERLSKHDEGDHDRAVRAARERLMKRLAAIEAEESDEDNAADGAPSDEGADDESMQEHIKRISEEIGDARRRLEERFERIKAASEANASAPKSDSDGEESEGFSKKRKKPKP